MKISLIRGPTLAALGIVVGCARGTAPPNRPTPAPQAGDETAPAPGVVSTNPTTTTPVGFYSTAQAERGAQVFRTICQECHSTSEFRGRDFEFTWRRQTVWDFYSQISSTMPEDNPGALSDQQYADVIAYILQVNRYASGETELVATREAMDVIPLGPDANKTGT